MGTLRKLKVSMKLDHDLRKMLVRGSRNEILIDIDGDKEADIALSDTTGDGNIDTIAVDLTGDGEFNLFFEDTTGNNIPDTVLFDDEEGDGPQQITDSKEETEAAMIEAARRIYIILQAQEYIASELDAALGDLDKRVRAARRELRRR